jgi:RNA polymerase sigma factor (sigma-70 family)
MAAISISMATALTDHCDDPSCNDCFESKLIYDLKERNHISFRRLYQSYSSSLLGIILRVVPSREIAEDILQDTFIKIWKSLDQYDPSKARLFTWMARMARNSAIDYKRGKTFAKSILNEDIDSVFMQVDRFHHVNDRSDTIGIRELMHRLPDSQKQVLNLVYFHGYTQAEVSDELQMPLGTVKSKIRLAVKALRTCFG